MADSYHDLLESPAMTSHTRWKFFLGGGLAVAAAPALQGCLSCLDPYGNCGKQSFVAWDGGFGDAGWVDLPDGGRAFDGGQLMYSNGTLTQEGCQLVCPNDGTYWTNCGPDGGLLECRLQCVGGRVPPGHQGLSRVDSSPGAWLSRMAELEGAAVHAFEHLAHELEAHGLRRQARFALEAAQDEVRHARAVARLALARGHCPMRPRIEATPLRSLFEVALDNAAEGCGRELVGAVVNAHQAEHAHEADVRAAMARIALEEQRHAELSRALAEALMPRLPLPQRRAVRAAQEQALERFVDEGATQTSVAAEVSLGLLNGAQLTETARSLLERARV
jgi:rubrerythrin